MNTDNATTVVVGPPKTIREGIRSILGWLDTHPNREADVGSIIASQTYAGISITAAAFLDLVPPRGPYAVRVFGTVDDPSRLCSAKTGDVELFARLIEAQWSAYAAATYPGMDVPCAVGDIVARTEPQEGNVPGFDYGEVVDIRAAGDDHDVTVKWHRSGPRIHKLSRLYADQYVTEFAALRAVQDAGEAYRDEP